MLILFNFSKINESFMFKRSCSSIYETITIYWLKNKNKRVKEKLDVKGGRSEGLFGLPGLEHAVHDLLLFNQKGTGDALLKKREIYLKGNEETFVLIFRNIS